MKGGSIEYLKPLRKYLAGQLLGLLTLVIFLVASIGILVASLSSVLYGVFAGVIVSLAVALAVSVYFSHQAIKGTDFLARAILYVDSNAVHIAAPDPKKLPVSQEFFAELSRNIYNMASKAYGLNDSDKIDSSSKMSSAMIQNSPIPILAMDNTNKVVFVNPSAEKYLALDSNKILNKPVHEVLRLTFNTKETLEDWLLNSAKSVATNNKFWERVKVSLPDDKAHYCDLAVQFNKDNPSGIESVVALFDHTDKYLNDEHGIGTISMAVHELRTPITAMRGYIEVFEDEIAPSLNTEQAGFMKALSAQAQQLGSFISNVQNFAKIEENAMTLSLKSEDWASIVSGAVKDMQLRAQVRKKQVIAEIPDNMPPVAVDKSTIYEVLINLIENAIKYTHGPEPIIVTCKILDNSFIETTIADKGIGIPDSILGNLFERFYRSHRSSASIGGMGLGLYLSKAIVTAHGGQIWVKSAEGKGSTFGFTVPTFDSVAKQNQTDNNTTIVRNAHGWIKNHNIYRG